VISIFHTGEGEMKKVLALNDIQKAREEFEFMIAMEPDPKLIPETMEEKEGARKKLEQLELKEKR
jgi:hypothetical protein